MHYLGEASVKTAEISEKVEVKETEENLESKSEVKILVKEKHRPKQPNQKRFLYKI